MTLFEKPQVTFVRAAVTDLGVAQVTWQEAYLQRFYRSRDGWIDGTSEFHALCRAFIAPSSRILEIGAGPMNRTSAALANIGPVVGIDPDPDVQSNPALSSSVVLQGNSYPFADESFDACASDFVLEHVTNPVLHFQEVHRVLGAGGVYVFRTPNRLHYVSLAASLLPHFVHQRCANRLRNMPAAAHDPYPTVYRANSAWRLRRLADSCGFRIEDLRMIEKEPSYGLSSRVLFLTFMLYERLVNMTALTKPLRANILAVFRKV